LIRQCHPKRRAALLGMADNRVGCKHPFRLRAARGRARGKDARNSRVRVALRFCRLAFHLVAGQQGCRPPGLQGRHSILDKLSAFHREHDTSAAAVRRDLQALLAQLPRPEYAAEAEPFHEERQRIQEGRRRGPPLLGAIVPRMLARLGIGAVPSEASGEQDPREPCWANEPRTPVVPTAPSLGKSQALSRVTNACCGRGG
jgi:hypothetical protein